jgi:hypothetical protein
VIIDYTKTSQVNTITIIVVVKDVMVIEQMVTKDMPTVIYDAGGCVVIYGSGG